MSEDNPGKRRLTQMPDPQSESRNDSPGPAKKHRLTQLLDSAIVYSSNDSNKEEADCTRPAGVIAGKPEDRSTQAIQRHHKLPWESYRIIFRRDLGGSVRIAQKKPATSELYAIRSLPGPDYEGVLNQISTFRGHDCFIKTLEVYEADRQCYVISECMATSLLEVANSGLALDEPQLAAIIVQVSTDGGCEILMLNKIRSSSVSCKYGLKTFVMGTLNARPYC